MIDEPRSRLGRGLAALMGEMSDEGVVVERARGGVRKIPTAFLKANARNPRRSFDDGELDQLAQSVREKGIVQPIIVRAVPNERDRYEIIAGERRWRAAQKVGLHEVPAILVEATDREALEIAIVENVQRADLDPLDEAAGYQQLIDEFDYTQEKLSSVIGKSRSHVANTLRLQSASDGVKARLRAREITAGHARAIMGAPDPDTLAERIVALGLSVREAEAMAQEEKGVAPQERARVGRPKVEKDADTKALEKALSDSLGLDVVIEHRDGGGRVRIGYRSLEQLDLLCRRLQGETG
jgi:ParB family chromosome partitioning protein